MFGPQWHRHHGRRFARDRLRAPHEEHPIRRGWRRRGRIFDHGDLRIVILQLIAERPRHGYEIIKEIEEKLGGSYSPSPGVVYPTLTWVEELGYATRSAGDDTRKLYAITPEGSAYLEAHKATVEAIFRRIDEVRSAHGGGPAPHIVRAMENLRFALRLRLSRGPLSDDQKHAIAAALDAAAVAIERS